MRRCVRCLFEDGMKVLLVVGLAIILCFESMATELTYSESSSGAGTETGATGTTITADTDGNTVCDYADKLSDYAGAGTPKSTDTVTTVFADKNNIMKTEDNRTGAFSDESNTVVDMNVTVGNAGLYCVSVDYYVTGNTGIAPKRRLLIDGAVPFDEANSLSFPEHWVDKNKPRTNSLGDQVKPLAVTVPQWLSYDLYDSEGMYSEPLLFWFSAGSHVITLEYVDQPMLVGAVTLVPPAQTPTYDQVKATYTDSEETQTVTFEAEDSLVWRTSSAAGLEASGDPMASPAGVMSKVYNTYGGYTWRSGGQMATWCFTVPADGLYKLDIRVNQPWSGNLPVYRRIEIDGKVPFAELIQYAFPYNRKWYSDVLGDENGAYLFQLTAGEHTISMTAVLGNLTEIYNAVDGALNRLSSLTRRIELITGQDPDPNYDYELTKNIPELLDDMQQIADILNTCKAHATELADGKRTLLGNQIESVEKQLLAMIRNPRTIAKRLTDMNNSVTTLGDLEASLQVQPLQIDYFTLCGGGDVVADYHSNFLQIVGGTLQNFVASFFKDYQRISSLTDNDVPITDTIDVWVSRGKEWAEVIKLLTDADFTAKTGIGVNINVLPSGQLSSTGVSPLLLAVSAGDAPDLVMGLGSNIPVEYAIRGVSADVSKMDGYDTTVSEILPTLVKPFTYNNAVYGLPETMYFRCLFYRTDIVKEYGITIPDTWDEFFNTTLPQLYENGMSAWIPQWFDMFLLQNGGSFYTADGLASGLDTPEAYAAFKEYVETYTVYGCPTTVNFFNRFRTGEIPMGLDGHGMYIQLISAAPELSGKWKIAPIPGTLRSDGTVDRSTAGYVGEADMVLQSSQKKEIAWKYMQWWLSAEIQTQFGQEVEGKIGESARWPTSNLKAFASLGWNPDDMNIIAGSWSNVKETPVVLGGYFTSRLITNAWNRCVVSYEPVRDSLEECVEGINTELQRRQQQYGIGGDE